MELLCTRTFCCKHLCFCFAFFCFLFLIVMRIYKTIIYICMWRGKGGDGWSRSLISGGHQTHHTKLRSAPFGAIYFEEGGSPASFAAARFICRSVLPVERRRKEGKV